MDSALKGYSGVNVIDSLTLLDTGYDKPLER